MRWVLLAVSVMSALVVGELVARPLVPDVFVERRMREGGVVTPYEPGVRAELVADEFRVGYAINRHGHRDRLDRSLGRTPGVARVALLGDSFAAGWGVELEETFAWRFEERTGLEMVNTAKNGGCPLWFVYQARWLTERFQPDWLLVQLFDNDPADNFVHAPGFPVEPGDRIGPLPSHLLPADSLRDRLAHRYDRSILRRRFRELGRWLRGKEMRRSPYVRPGARAEARVLSREQAIAVHTVDFSPSSPWEGDFSLHDPAQQEAWRERLAWNRELLEQLLVEAKRAGVPVALLYIPHYPVFFREPTVNRLADDVEALAARHGATWIDTREIFGAYERPWELYHAWDGHLNAAGHDAVARGLVERLAPRVRTPGRQATRARVAAPGGGPARARVLESAWSGRSHVH